MTSLDLYYAVRPFIPRWGQILLRQWTSRFYRSISFGSWPVLESAGRAPEQWEGWPEGRRFALVLTHDVETQRGHDRCQALVRLEEELGFRSAFNFVPERYRVSPELRADLIRRGFEVGVHGLRHDGRDFGSRRSFERRAPHMNRYLREWNAVGFRAPSMRRNLEWIQALDLEYDSSTFDTDPFEPQPEGVHTVFPFWVEPAGGRPGFVELPYTLPQDFTLFTLLRERTIDVWKEKLDWVASKGGMVLVNVHPDYAAAEGKTARWDEYPLQRYRELLDYVRTRYAGCYWHALPRDVARLGLSHPERIRPRPPPRRACFVACARAEHLPRLRRCAEALARRGDDVEVIGLRAHGETRRELTKPIRVFRIQACGRRRGAAALLLRWTAFWLRSSILLAVRGLWRPYDIIQVHAPPLAEAFAAWLPRRRGASVILDLPGLLPERATDRLGLRPRGPFFRWLVRRERAAARFADHVLVPNHLCQERLTGRSVAAARCSVAMDWVELARFPAREPERPAGVLRALAIGPAGGRPELATAIEAVALARREEPRLEFHHAGDAGPAQRDLEALAARLGAAAAVRFHGVVADAALASLVAGADIGLGLARAGAAAGDAFEGAILEFLSQSVPVIASQTPGHTYYLDDSLVLLFEAGNARDLARRLLEVVREREACAQRVRRGLEFIRHNHWEARVHEYLELADRLAPNRPARMRP